MQLCHVYASKYQIHIHGYMRTVHIKTISINNLTLTWNVRLFNGTLLNPKLKVNWLNNYLLAILL